MFNIYIDISKNYFTDKFLNNNTVIINLSINITISLIFCFSFLFFFNTKDGTFILLLNQKIIKSEVY